MKWILGMMTFSLALSASAQVWKTLPAGVRILGYRNVITSKVTSNFNQFRSESPLGAQFLIDAKTLDQIPALGGALAQTLPKDAYDAFVAGEYKIDASAQFNVQGSGFGWGITDKVMFYGEIAYYKANVNANIKRLRGNSYEEFARKLAAQGGNLNSFLAENAKALFDANESTVQSFITNYYGYKPIGDWYGAGYGDMEAGLMARLVDTGTWGLLYYPGVVLPTGRQDDPDILQDVGFGDGQFDLFNEFATGYVINDNFSIGTTFRYTYQAPSTKTLRIPGSRDYTLSDEAGNFNVKYGDRINWMLTSTINFNDWFSITPSYRYMYQMSSVYDSQFSDANNYLSYNSDKQQHQVQLTTTVSTIQPFLKKKFALPTQINMNLVDTFAGKNVPKVGRFEVEIRMLF